MKRTKKNLVLLLAILSVLLCGGIFTLSVNYKNTGNRIVLSGVDQQEIDNYAQSWMILKAHELDPKSEIADWPDEVWTRLEGMLESYGLGDDNPNFRWQISINKKSKGSSELPSAQDSVLYGKYTVKDDNVSGIVQNQDELKTGSETSGFSQSIISGTLRVPWLVDEVYRNYYANETGWHEIPDAKLNLPNGLTFIYSIPETYQSNPYNSIFSTILTGEQERDFARNVLWIFFGFEAAAVLLVLLWPKSEEEKIKIFGWFTKLPVEWIVLILLISCFLLMVCLGILLPKIARAPFTNLSNLQMFMMLASYLFVAFLWITSLVVFLIKVIFSIGPLKYLKENSLIIKYATRFFRYVKRKFAPAWNTLMKNVWFKKNGWKIFSILSAALALLALATGNILVMFLAFAIVIGWQTRINMKTASALQTVDSQASLLAQGNFESVQNQSDEMVQPILDSLSQVRDSYKKSLQEELTSRETKNELIANVSHDLKTPLTGLKNYSELLIRCQDEEDCRKYAQKINDYTQRLSVLVEDLFDISKANANALELEIMDVRLDELIDGCLEEHQGDTELENMVISYHERPITLKLDPYKTMRIFDNLIVNASKYSLPNTRIFISTRNLDDKVEVTVKNTSAMPLNFTPEEIVERFVRGDKSRHEVGSGLGLAIVKSFTEIQDGSFRIEIDGDLFKAILTFPKTKDEANVPPSTYGI